MIRGGPGDDRCLAATDGESNDIVFGGSGVDVAQLDAGDSRHSIEQLVVDCLQA